ncbi:MAG: flavodoxin family protein [Aigarchaeota archaeon]|nr:flavodoxin family protein [Aigarchaeota archaeon]MDW8022026.1 flavodoxin family protein [Nitrososphaerota archaeon]
MGDRGLKSLIICTSIHHENTLKIGMVIAEVIGAEIVRPLDIDPSQAAAYDLLGFGSGVYYGNLHSSIREFVERLPQSRGKRVFIFSTSGLPKIPLLHDYHRSVRETLRMKGYEVVGEFTCRGLSDHGPLKWLGGVNKGRPNEYDLRDARKFAEKLLHSLR